MGAPVAPLGEPLVAEAPLGEPLGSGGPVGSPVAPLGEPVAPVGASGRLVVPLAPWFPPLGAMGLVGGGGDFNCPNMFLGVNGRLSLLKWGRVPPLKLLAAAFSFILLLWELGLPVGMSCWGLDLLLLQ